MRLALSNGFFPSGLPTKILYARLVSPMRAIRRANLILVDLITRIVFGEQYRSHGLHEGYATDDSFILGYDILPLGESFSTFRSVVLLLKDVS